jgi:hypothetical protein
LTQAGVVGQRQHARGRGSVGLDAGVFGKGGAGFFGLRQAQFAGRHQVEAERREEFLNSASLPALWVASTSRSPRRGGM